jgi:predicted metal-binding protein
MKTFKLQQLIDCYHRPDDIYDYCKSCGYYNQNHSCPDHSSDILSKYNQDDYISVYLLTMSYSDDSDLSLEYRITRHKLDLSIKAFELSTESNALIPGRCLLCDPCKKSLSRLCPYPGRMRYSLETLGFNLSDLAKNEFDFELKWDQQQITYIFGFIHKTEITKDFNKFMNF